MPVEEFDEVKQRLLNELQRFRQSFDDPLLDASKLKKLAAEHDHVAEQKKNGRYGKGEEWQYLRYLQD